MDQPTYNDVVFLWKTKNDGGKKNDVRRMMACLYKNDVGTKHNLKKSDIEECGRTKIECCQSKIE